MCTSWKYETRYRKVLVAITPATPWKMTTRYQEALGRIDRTALMESAPLPLAITESGEESRVELGVDSSRLPFKIGEVVETKSFSRGFRGSWFLCEIMDMDHGSHGLLRYKLRYVDFPGEPLHWTQAYQQRHRGKFQTKELMVRPKPPPVLHENDASYDGLVLIPNAWEVGDLVNWWRDTVWWEATICDIRPKGKARISLLQEPVGEGGTHIVNIRDLRPSLSWSISDQWSVPISKVKANHAPAAKLVDLSSKMHLQLSGPVHQRTCATKPLDSHAKLKVIDNSDTTLPNLEALGKEMVLYSGKQDIPDETTLSKDLMIIRSQGQQPHERDQNQVQSRERNQNRQEDSLLYDSDGLLEALSEKRRLSRILDRKFQRYRKRMRSIIELLRQIRAKRQKRRDRNVF